MCKARNKEYSKRWPTWNVRENRQVSMKYGLVIPICRKCHEIVTNDKSLQDKLHKVAQKEFKKHYKTENFVQIFGKII